jgi:amino acid permease
MWIPKTEEEIKEFAKEKEKKARIFGAFYALFIFIIVIFIAKYVGFKEDILAPHGQKYTWTQIFHNLPKFSIFSLVFGIVIYFSVRKYRQMSSLICDKCRKIKVYDKVRDCNCGGHFVFLDEMNWIEDEKPENDNDDTKKNT